MIHSYKIEYCFQLKKILKDMNTVCIIVTYFLNEFHLISNDTDDDKSILLFIYFTKQV